VQKSKITDDPSIFGAVWGSQRYTLAMKLIQTLLVMALTGLSFAASAQWQWIDKDGRKVYSDRAPPAEVQDRNILKRPGSAKVPVAPSPEADGEVAAPTQNAAQLALPASAVKPTALEKELEAKKKQVQDAEAAKKKVAEEQFLKSKIENCARAKQAKATIESGARVGRTNAAGEVEVMDDVARTTELKRIQDIVNRDCR
jgi:hypothetical protein